MKLNASSAPPGRSALLYLPLAAIAAFAVSLPFVGFLHGDAFIHYIYGSNLVSGMPFQFNPGEYSGGSTAPLWSAFTGLLYLVGGREWIDLLAKAVGVGAFSLSVCLLFVLCRKQGLSEKASLLAAALFGLFPAAGYWAGSGMETLPYVALLLGAFIAFRSERSMLTGGLLALGALLRPETLVVAGVFALLRWRRAHLLLLPPAVALGGFLAVQWGVTGHLIPSSWLCRSMVARQQTYTGLPFFDVSSIVYLAIFGLPLLVLAPFRARLKGRETALAVAALLVAFSTVIPSSYGLRYLLPIVPLLAVLAASAATRLPRAAGVLLLVSAIAYTPGFWLKIRHHTTRTWERYETWGNYFDERECSVLAREVQLAWFTEQRVVSLDGVTGWDVFPYSEPSHLIDFVRAERPDWLFGVVGIRSLRNNRYWRATFFRDMRLHMLVQLGARLEPSFEAGGVTFTLAGPAVYSIRYNSPLVWPAP